jgi:hypothetical protein
LRLWSRAHGTYLHVEEDGLGITLRRRRGTLNEAWAGHRLERDGANYVLVHGAAYGRYLALVREEAPPAPAPFSSGQGEEGGARRARHTCRAVQRVYDAPGQDDVLWEVLGADDGSGDVLIRHRTFGAWRNYDDQRTTMQWMVEAIPPRANPPELPPVIPVSSPSPLLRSSDSHRIDPGVERLLESVDSATFFSFKNH